MKPRTCTVKILPILVAVFVALPAISQAACPRPAIAGSGALLPTGGNFDAALLDRTILAATNHQRCLHNLPAMKPKPALRKPAQGHSNWMASRNKLSHRSSVSGLRKLKDRVGSTGLSVHTAAENLASLPLFDLTPRFRVIDARKCRFTSLDGKPLAPHSYRSFARQLVHLWMDSPGHRKNLLGGATTHMGSAATFRSDRKTCGTVYVTQIFIG